MKQFDINTPFKGNGWFFIPIQDRTHRTLSNGRRIPTTLNMIRKAAKLCE